MNLSEFFAHGTAWKRYELESPVQAGQKLEKLCFKRPLNANLPLAVRSGFERTDPLPVHFEKLFGRPLKRPAHSFEFNDAEILKRIQAIRNEDCGIEVAWYKGLDLQVYFRQADIEVLAVCEDSEPIQWSFIE